MAFGLTVVWAHPYQAHLSSLDEVVKKLTLLINSGDNWAYTFVWLNKDAQHVPLPKEGHLSTMIDGTSSMNACRHLHQLEMHQLLQYGDGVVYPKGLNGVLEPVLTSLSEALVQGVNMLGEPSYEPSFLPVDLSWVTQETMHPKFQLPAEHLHQLPIPISLWNVPLKQIATSAWPLRSKSSYHMLCWTPQARHQGTPPEEADIQGHGRRLLQAGSYFHSSIIMIGHAWWHQAIHPNSWDGLPSYYPTNQNSWGWHGHPPWGSDFTSRGYEQDHGAPAHDQGI